MKDLFREEARPQSASRLPGQIVLGTPLSFQFWVATTVLIVASAVIYLCSVQFSRREKLDGLLIPKGGVIRVVARQAGVVDTVDVTEGQAVRAGQILATIQSGPLITSGDAFQAEVKALELQSGAATAKLEAARRRDRSQLSALEESRRFLERELSETARLLALQEERLRLARMEVDRGRSVAARGYMTAREMERRQTAALAEEQGVSQTNRSLISLRREIADVDAQIRALPGTMATVEAEAAEARAQLQRTRIQSEASNVNQVVARVDGRLTAMAMTSGEPVQAGSVLAWIVPEGSLLEAELYAPSRAIGFLKPGQEVRLMYEPFPFQKFGVARGVITSISHLAVPVQDLGMAASQSQEPVFRVRVRLPQQSVSAYGRLESLQPGTRLSAEVVVDRRSLFEWLLDPVFAVKGR